MSYIEDLPKTVYEREEYKYLRQMWREDPSTRPNVHPFIVKKGPPATEDVEVILPLTIKRKSVPLTDGDKLRLENIRLAEKMSPTTILVDKSEYFNDDSVFYCPPYHMDRFVPDKNGYDDIIIDDSDDSLSDCINDDSQNTTQNVSEARKKCNERTSDGRVKKGKFFVIKKKNDDVNRRSGLGYAGKREISKSAIELSSRKNKSGPHDKSTRSRFRLSLGTKCDSLINSTAKRFKNSIISSCCSINFFNKVSSEMINTLSDSQLHNKSKRNKRKKFSSYNDVDCRGIYDSYGNRFHRFLYVPEEDATIMDDTNENKKNKLRIIGNKLKKTLTISRSDMNIKRGIMNKLIKHNGIKHSNMVYSSPNLHNITLDKKFCLAKNISMSDSHIISTSVIPNLNEENEESAELAWPKRALHLKYISKDVIPNHILYSKEIDKRNNLIRSFKSEELRIINTNDSPCMSGIIKPNNVSPAMVKSFKRMLEGSNGDISEYREMIRIMNKPFSQYTVNENGKTIKKVRSFRTSVIRELVSTEDDYVCDLGSLILDVLSPICRMKILSPEEEKKLCSNIEELHHINNVFLNKLLDRIIDHGDDDLDDLKIADILLDFIRDLHAYSYYCTNYSGAMVLYVKLMGNNPLFKEFIQTAMKDPCFKSLNFMAYLIKPVQRICKYPLLFKDIAKHTSKISPEMMHLKICISELDDIMHIINNSTHMLDIDYIYDMIDSKIIDPFPVQIKGSHIVREGYMSLVSGFRTHKCYCLLLESVFIVLKVVNGKNFNFLCAYPIEPNNKYEIVEETLRLVLRNYKWAFKFSILNRSISHMFVVNSESEKIDWTKSLKYVLKRCKLFYSTVNKPYQNKMLSNYISTYKIGRAHV